MRIKLYTNEMECSKSLLFDKICYYYKRVVSPARELGKNIFVSTIAR